MRTINLANLQQFTAINVLSDPGVIGGPVVIPSCARIYISWNNDAGKSPLNILYGRYTGAFSGTTTQATAIANALRTGAQWTALAAFLSTTSALNGVWIQDVNTPQNAILVGAGPGSAGTSASPALPAETAACVTLRTAKVGIANRGRMYIPGWATNALGTGNVIAPAAVTALGNWASTISAALSAQGYTWVIGQPARAAYIGSTGTPHAARPAGSTPVTSATVRDNHWDSQRRRGLK